MGKYFGVLIIFTIWSCTNDNNRISSFQVLDENLEIQLIAQEPMLIAPVAIDFDKAGRIWVAEMPDYMPDINGEKESIPAGRIVILEDSNGDGFMDSSKTFLEKIHHLRSIKLYRDGILYADDSTLYYAKIDNDKATSTYIVDSIYSQGGNIEHKPNGLLLNIDNCIYSAKSHFRYCLEGEKWHKEVTNFRGQWGITADENGRLYSNDNSNYFFGDQFLPNTVIKNEYQHRPEGLNIDLVGDRSVFPIQSTAINRGYEEGSLDENGFIKSTTSACSPYIYQSAELGEHYANTAFVCVPEANLIKLLTFKQNDFLPNADFYFDSTEFLTSTDEAFRPVNITAGPDGDLYIVDFHRGIIQHKIYMTKYLRNQILERKLDNVTDFGRILKLTNKNKAYHEIKYDFNNEDSLLHYLSSDNTWLRSKAQECLIPLQSQSIDSKLHALAINGGKLAQLHSLWTLSGRRKIDLERITEKKFTDPWVIANLLKLVSENRSGFSNEEVLSVINIYKKNENPIVKNHLLTSISGLYESFPAHHEKLLKGADNSLASAKIAAYPSGTIIKSIDSIITNYNENVKKEKRYYIYSGPPEGSSEGYELYNANCASCHGFGGQGIQGLAPALEGGTLVNASVEVVPLIILNGLNGQVTIGGQKLSYSAAMPSFNLSGKEIEKITNYIYNAFGNEVKSISFSTTQQLIRKYSDRDRMWSEEELLNTDF